MTRAQYLLPLPRNGNNVNTAKPSQSPNRSVDAYSSTDLRNHATAPSSTETPENRRHALLLDLSGNKDLAMEWASALLPGRSITRLNKADLKWTSRRHALASVRALKPDALFVFSSELKMQSSRAALMLFAVLAGARRVAIGDGKGHTVLRSRTGVILAEAPRLVLELIVGYGLIVPLLWLLTELFSASLRFRRIVRATRARPRLMPDHTHSSTALYVRATLTSVAEGGMRSHVAGFAAGAEALGHRLKFLVSGSERDDKEAMRIEPSLSLSATKTLFELWNNLAFTVKSLQLIARAGSSDEFDFIYQRYSRFNWTGVALSLMTGLPLLLEYNGSEVWIARQWDPIGQLWLLKRFERVNQRAADLIFVVSEVEGRNLIEAGVTPKKIIVNPNGVDPDRFRPNCGGADVRRAYGIEDRIVVGFVGTFGPWHGAPVLAEAARDLKPQIGCHFLFIGDGDQRAQSESIIEASAARATFTGRISHDKVPAYLDACDILVSPHISSNDGSAFFGSPTKLFEYMAMTKPIVASRLGQLAEVIIDGENGLLVEPGDAGALTRAIERLAHDETLRARLGAAARQAVIARYTWRHNAARVFEAAQRLR